jgi:hypothetical protein
MVAAVRVLQTRLRKAFALFHSMRLGPRPDQHDFRARQKSDNERLDAGIVRLLEPDHDRLRLPPDEAANALRAVTFALTHPIVGNGRHTQPQQIADLVLHGIATEAKC